MVYIKKTNKRKKKEKIIEEKAKKEAELEVAKEKEKALVKFQEILLRSRKQLYRISSMFPFDLFPDHLVIDLTKVNVVIADFIFTKRFRSIDIDDIGDVFVYTAFFFSSLTISEKSPGTEKIRIRFLKNSEAKKARRIIQGLVVAKKLNVELNQFDSIPDLVEKLELLGETKKSAED